MIFPHIILHYAVHIYDFQILITLYRLCRNLFALEITRKVACDLVISYAIVALMTILAKLFHFC